MSIESVKSFRLDDGEPSKSLTMAKREEEAIPPTPYEEFLEEVGTVAERNKRLQDWYFALDPYQPSEKELRDYEKKLDKMEDWQREQLEFGDYANLVTVKNVGGLIMPLVLDIEFTNGRERRLEIPPEIWRYGNQVVKIPFISNRKVREVVLDPDNAFADADLANNRFPRGVEEGRFKLIPRSKSPNPMRSALFPKEEEKDESED